MRMAFTAAILASTAIAGTTTGNLTGRPGGRRLAQW